ncbi:MULTISPECIES: OB-fold putative lipoprotein [Flavobacterium]|uniref:OB-fold putative lipoprotein n=1 Tax=Flavobacterium TaxID=237 RepID=UPI002115C0DB|nr:MULTISPECIES: OB-fold putative lipoprotein [Flavobacterium]UUF14707.1 OB-fold putative lipoprotein [Flavobacterium panici]
MNKRKITILIVLLLVSFGPYYIYQNIIYKDARDINNEKSILTISAKKLENHYAKNALQADSKYLNKTIEIEGTATEVTDSSMVIDGKVFCKMNEIVKTNFTNKPINIKGRCIGFDDLFGVVKLDQCSIQQN